MTTTTMHNGSFDVDDEDDNNDFDFDWRRLHSRQLIEVGLIGSVDKESAYMHFVDLT